MRLLIIFVLWLAIIGNEVREAQIIPCDTDSECMRLNGGDGSPNIGD